MSLNYVKRQFADPMDRNRFLEWAQRECPRLIYTLEQWFLEYKLTVMPLSERAPVLKDPFMYPPRPPTVKKKYNNLDDRPLPRPSNNSKRKTKNLILPKI